MNRGKICVSICAETADELLEDVKRAEKSADIIELRFDCLDESEIVRIRNSRVSGKEEIRTFRPKAQGGKGDGSEEARLKFWNDGNAPDWVDLELDLLERNAVWNRRKMICSHHDFGGVPANLDEIYNRMKATKASVLKLAVRADDVADTIEIWKLLERAKRDGKQIVPIAMGEAGKWTRILGLAHGAPLTYAALETGKETAAGQLTAQDLTSVYRVQQLDERTEVYGIVGNPTAHSLSPLMHNAAFQFHDLNAVYIPFAVKNLDEFVAKFIKEETREINLNFKGFSVTIPHKQAIIKHVDWADETARKIGAVNTVKIEDGKLYGFNTDADGFIEPLKTAYGDLENAKVAVLGAGGAARAAIYALKNEGAIVNVYARNLKSANVLAEDFDVEIEEFTRTGNQNSKNDFNDFDVLVNATPLGTKGELERETPAFAAQITGVKLIYDLIYNPFETALIKEARKVGVPTLGGLAMLVAQGMKQFEIWTDKAAPMRAMSAAALRRIKN